MLRRIGSGRSGRGASTPSSALIMMMVVVVMMPVTRPLLLLLLLLLFDAGSRGGEAETIDAGLDAGRVDGFGPHESSFGKWVISADRIS